MNKVITIKEYISTLGLGRPVMDDQAMCANKWTYLYVHFDAGVVKNCYNVPPRNVTLADIEQYGTDIFFNHPYEIARRQEKLDNIRHSDCNNCWECENRGVRSRRNPEPFYEAHRGRFKTPRGTEALPTTLELYFNNTCDLKCIYCDEMSSSQWGSELKRFGEYFPIHTNTIESSFKKVFYEWFEKEGCHEILSYNVLGGEPLIQNEFYEFVDYLLDAMQRMPNRHNIKPELSLFTNGNTPAKYMDKWLVTLEKLQEHVSIRIDFSNESVGARSEFIRSNLNWNTFESNINRTIEAAKGKDIRVRLGCAHNALSIPTFIEYLKWADALQKKHEVELTFGSNSVVQPSYLAVWNLTDEFKNNLTEAVDWIRNNVAHWNEYADYLLTIRDGLGKYNLDDLISIPRFVERMKERRGLDFAATFPELGNWYKFCNEAAAKGK